MAIVIGINAGFVTEAPVDDPAGLSQTCDKRSMATKDTSPAGAVKVTEIGWWLDNDTVEANFEVGIYDHNVSDDEPENLLDGVSRTNAKGTTAGWKRVTGLNIIIEPETIYWIAFQLDDLPTGFPNTNYVASGRGAQLINQTTLPNPWGTSTFLETKTFSIYAVWEAAPVGTNMQINISDTLKDVSEMKINIGGVLKDVVQVQQNIGGVLKNVFG